ncbi:MAG: bifunctional histidinol-phosphatase/imidazoleglycerol-phosphate dehydratase HisB [Bacteroidales bacterium]|nr:bifunctional histidinol-phosphatase/imidazoleglycerol-phosphate dehydratase HisB [Bacteroidales bacterium]
MKRVLFIDRDGTLIKEPLDTEQVDSLEKLEFLPGVFQAMHLIAKNMDYELVIVSNQDGLGTESFPEDDFWPPHNKMLEAFKNEGVIFTDVFIDRTLPDDNAQTRKPNTGMLTEFTGGDYDLKNSFVIGDRLTDVSLARNLGAKGILLSGRITQDELQEAGLEDFCELRTSEWMKVYEFLLAGNRKAVVERKTGETEICISLDLDGGKKGEISTGLGFFDHMLDQISRHAGITLNIEVKGDLDVDEHHTIEDTALALGEAFNKALFDKRGMERYGFALPMDDCLAQVAIDFGGRPWIVWETEFKRERVGDMPTEMFFHFFKSFSDAARCNLNIKAEGDNEHHKIEAIFKAFARAIRMAIRRDVFHFELPSTKGVL